MKYQFGDQDLAAKRLEVVARVFEKTTRGWLQEAANQPVRLALDLGCGPGFTTRLLAEVFDRGDVVGLDSSERFLNMARGQENVRIRYRRHDVLTIPFPEAPADLIFCRFLLSHLPDPLRCLSDWATQLSAGGSLVIEEVEAIETAQPVFSEYLHIVELMLADQNTVLYVGPVLECVPELPRFSRRISRECRFAVSNRDAATMFSMNIPNWKDRPFVRENFGDAAIERLQSRLRDFAERPDDTSEITWVLRQVAFVRETE